MGIETWVRKQLRARFASAFSFETPQYDMVAEDFMETFKGTLPVWVVQLVHLRRLVMAKIDSHFNSPTGCQVVVACVDRDSPGAKRFVTHGKRYERRCSECRAKGGDLPKGRTAGPEYFSLECKREIKCIDNQIMWAEEGPYLDMNEPETQNLPNWDRFSADTRNLRREIYPLMMNWILAYQFSRPGLMIITNGLPCKTQIVRDWEKDFVEGSGFHATRDVTTKTILVPWTTSELPRNEQRDDYSRVYIMKSHPPSAQHPHGHISQEEDPAMRNTIQEADNAVFFFSRFFPHLKRCMAHINDGDAIPIGLFRAAEDFTGGPEPVQEQWVSLKYSSRDAAHAFLSSNMNVPTREYVNLTLLYQRVQSSREFVQAGVQSPMVTLILLIILGGSDFFKGEWCFNISGVTDWNEDEEKRSKQTMGFWDTFFDKLSMFTHMVQYYPQTASTTEPRLVVLDEDLFADYTGFCHINKYSKTIVNTRKRKKRKTDNDDETSVTLQDVVMHCSKLDHKKHFPTPQRLKRLARQIQWNLNYWANAFRGIYIDPFEEHMGLPYWGYHPEKGIVDEVSPKQKGLDETHKRHMSKRKEKEQVIKPIIEKRRKSAIEAVRGQ